MKLFHFILAGEIVVIFIIIIAIICSYHIVIPLQLHVLFRKSQERMLIFFFFCITVFNGDPILKNPI